jgi:hypothetical protein
MSNILEALRGLFLPLSIIVLVISWVKIINRCFRFFETPDGRLAYMVLFILSFFLLAIINMIIFQLL